MPQLDTLTYFSQYVYLVGTFIAVYIFVLRYIMPLVITTFKLRQKLQHSSNFAHPLAFDHWLTDPERPPLFNFAQMQSQDKAKMDTKDHLDPFLEQNWKLRSAQKKLHMLISARKMQFCIMLRFKKLLFNRNICIITPQNVCV